MASSGEMKRKRICFFGHFGSPNFGNELTLQAVLHHVRELLPDAEVACVCTGPETLAATQRIEALPISPRRPQGRKFRAPLARFFGKLFLGIPREVGRWFEAFRTLRGTDLFIIPGTGLLTDAYGLMEWGPYNLFKWSVAARLRGCRLRFVSVGAGPVYGALGRCLIRTALSLADFRSYRDSESRDYLNRIGFRRQKDRVYPDLVFSFPESGMPRNGHGGGRRPVVGLGLMVYAGKYSVAHPAAATYARYLENLAEFVEWLLVHEYDLRLLIGEVGDQEVSEELKALLQKRLRGYEAGRIIDEAARSPEECLRQLAASDIVVATRFHNILLALLLDKPVLAISFHHKCGALMSQMGLSEYCHDINRMDAGRLIGQFQDAQRNAARLRPMIRHKVEESRRALEEQYGLILQGGLPN
jgi:polysaccharide pyruvyl transferase WcaK-like protein